MLLSQQSLSQNPHRVSAKELLERGQGAGGLEEGGSQGAGGSVRRRGSPWKDKRFSVIQEEPGEERRSKESLLNDRK